MLSSLPTLSLLLAPLATLASPSDGRHLVKRENIDYEWREGEAKPNHCTLRALGGAADDSDNLAAAVDMCGTDGVIELVDPM